MSVTMTTRPGRLLPAILLGGLLLGILISLGCTKISGANDAATSTERPSQTEIMQLVQPPMVPPPIDRDGPAVVKIELETSERVGTLADGVEYTYWTFNDTVPGPILRVREGDTVELTLKNSPDSRAAHSIDLHAVTGPGGGAKVMQISPGKEKTFTFKALNPGVFVYHCATPVIPQHIANGNYTR